MAERMTVKDLMSDKVATVARRDTVEIADGVNILRYATSH